MEPYVITISRQFASLGRSIAQETAKELGIEFYDRDIVEATAKRMGLPVSLISSEEELAGAKFFRRKYPLGTGLANMQDEIYEVQSNIIYDMAAKESCIIVGRCANWVLKDHPKKLDIYIYAPYEYRLRNCIEVLQMNPKNAVKMIKEVDKAREAYRKRYCKTYLSPYDGHDMMIDSSKFGVEGSVALIRQIIEKNMF